MLSLQSRTPASFARRFEEHLEEMLVDHAHCEKKAASTALNLLFRHADDEDLVRVMAEIVEEEIQHFRIVLDLLDKRGMRFRRQKPSAYAGKLHQLARTGEPEALLDRLLIGALIEARSCERFDVLAHHLVDPELAAFYRSLFESEARHYATYLRLALKIFDEPTVRARLDELAHAEAGIVEQGEPAPRLHA